MPLGVGASIRSSEGARWNVVTPNPTARGTGLTAVPRTTAPGSAVSAGSGTGLRIRRTSPRGTAPISRAGPTGHAGQRGSQDPRERPGPPRAGGGAQPGRGRPGQPGQPGRPVTQPGTESRSGTCGPIRTGRIPAGPIFPLSRRSGSGHGPSGRSRDHPGRSGRYEGPYPSRRPGHSPAWGRADTRAGRRDRSECRGQRLPVRRVPADHAGRAPGAAARRPRRDLAPWRDRAASQARTRPGRPRRPPPRPGDVRPVRADAPRTRPPPPPVPAPLARTGRRALTGGRAGTREAGPRAGTATAGHRTATSRGRQKGCCPQARRGTPAASSGPRRGPQERARTRRRPTSADPARPTGADPARPTGADPGEASRRRAAGRITPRPGNVRPGSTSADGYRPGPRRRLRAPPRRGLRTRASGGLRARARRRLGPRPAAGYGPGPGAATGPHGGGLRPGLGDG